jgi:diguanylate cyclase (GGDEF)-like protein
MSRIERTISLKSDPQPGGDAIRSLVQIHPLDLKRGPIPLYGGCIKLGRSNHCDLQVRDDSISREHAEIRLTDRGSVILDLESTNGVMVNGKSVRTHRLASGDSIQIGSHVFRFLADEDLESQYHATVYSMMTRDGLTGAYSERYLEETLEREIARCKRHARPLAVLIIELDQFKSANDRYGWIIGDQLLRGVSQRLQGILRKDDVLARLGGEKLAVAMVEVSAEEAVEIADRCRIAIRSELIPLSVGPIAVTLSVGVAAPLPSDLGSAAELLRDAIERMEEAKRGGGNRTVV